MVSRLLLRQSDPGLDGDQFGTQPLGNVAAARGEEFGAAYVLQVQDGLQQPGGHTGGPGEFPDFHQQVHPLSIWP